MVIKINLSEGTYEIYDKFSDSFKLLSIQDVDRNYINIDDCLWYWEYYDDVFKIVGGDSKSLY
ncbi:hypothetical protein CDQ74_06030 [Campylobacter hyointestinalis subsp. hyointestinalis]|uniref:Uncharacterized protein n=1 Tax=Campylobacter hyointestinalis subsp. hyointestinalis TaxID=91352 RepID=A0A855ND27_CAMHY|nr:hypothetical protein CDQ70_05265 [Campylobacter hyointestinalis subsp. hyointestinalis]PPB62924.1 hypothetical protein CDQ74_06030 [Campylobacter hyointestinalis subsp. hyointestinalis]PPB71311.1 hypothetical protein CDQ78_06425 [Campylobacter hyointestinalis subsp. hyointestinalis]